MATTFNQGVSATPVLINSSNVFILGNTASGSALNVRQFGTGNCLTVSNASGAVGLTVSGTGAVGIGGVVPSLLTDTFTISGNTAFVGNVTVTTDASSNNYVLAKRTPAGSLDVTQYVTGSVPLTTTTNLIQKYLSNAATVSATGVGGYAPTLYYPGTANSRVVIPYQTSVMRPASNLFMEAWVYLGSTSAPSTFAIFTSENTAGGTDDFSIRFLGNPISSLQVYIYNTVGSSYGATATYSFPVGWVYIAASFNATAGATYLFYCVSGTSTVSTTGTWSGTQRVTAGNNLYIGSRQAAATDLNGHIYDARIIRGGVVPTGSYTINSSTPYLFSSAPTYVAGMSTGYTSNLTLALQSQYFPGASTSPYGPCLTLPGTVGSCYSQSTTALNTSLNSGFTIEAWVNYASLANSSATSGTIFKASPTATPLVYDWFLGPTTTGQLAFLWSATYGTNYSLNTSGTITTGSWNHIVCQANNTGYVNMFINGQIQTLTATGFAGSGTAVALNISVPANQYSGVTIGQYNNIQGPNFAIAKARVLFGANTYTTSTFTPNPNLGPIPAGGTVAWQLESQFPQPTYPSFFDVPVLPQQTPVYGAEPTPIGGVTSNVLGPYATTYPQLDSVRFDGTGYIDYGNAASSALTTNLWANAWTIEAWVYLNSYASTAATIWAKSSSLTVFDGFLWINSAGQTIFQYNSGSGQSAAISAIVSLRTWTHVALTYDGTNSNIYVGGTFGGTSVSGANMPFTPTQNFQFGAMASGTNYFINGNLADVRVSNVARYTGSTYTVPSAPFTTDANTLLLLKSLAGQVGTTLAVQGRGLGSVSLGAGRTVNAYPPAPMSSYLLDTTSNASVTYGQGKYVASASSEYSGQPAWVAFDGNGATAWGSSVIYTGGVYNGAVTTVDTLGNAYAGEWIQVQMPVSVILSSYSLVNINNSYQPILSWMLGSRDGINWTVVFKYAGPQSGASSSYTVSATQGYNYYRLVMGALVSANATNIYTYVLNGTEESLCVTSDSKVGVGIANPQRALEVAGDLVVSGTISGGAGMGQFRNRIINGDMRIAQRGTSNVLPYVNATYTYLIDRLAIQIAGPPTSGVITQYQTALGAAETPYQLGLRNYANVVVSVGFNGTAANPVHIIEGYNIQDFNWGTSFASPVTLSFWFRSNAPIGSMFSYSLVNYGYGSASYVGTFTIASSGTWQYYTFTVPPPPNGSTWGSGTNGGIIVMIAPYYIGGYTSTVNAWNSGSYTYFPYGGYPWPTVTGTYINFTGVQLEKGTVATPFEFRPYATELALCQRYYQKSYDDGVAPGTVGQSYLQAYFTSTSGGSYSFPFPVRMRGTPVLTAYSINNGAAGYMYGPGPNASYAVSTAASQWGGEIYPSVSTYTVPNYYYFAWTASAEL